jgi:hypothetical protein
MKTKAAKLVMIVGLCLLARLGGMHAMDMVDQETFNLIVVLVCISIPFLAVAGLGVVSIVLTTRYHARRNRRWMSPQVRQEVRQRVKTTRTVILPNGTRLVQTDERDT